MIYRPSIARVVALAAACVMVTAGCAAARPEAAPVVVVTTSATPTASARCGPPDATATAVRTPSSGAELRGYEVGSGPRGVLLVPERGGLGLCGWWPYAVELAGRGLRVLLFDDRCTGASSCPTRPAPDGLLDDITAGVDQLRRDGAPRTVLIGASQGAAEVVIAGTRPPAGVVGVVALSADELTESLAAPPYPATARAAAPELRLPCLFAVAADDPYVSVVDSQELERAAVLP